MATHIMPASYRCDCGHLSHLSSRVLREMCEQSRRKPQTIRDAEKDPHIIEFRKEGAVAVICPRLGRCEITGTE